MAPSAPPSPVLGAPIGKQKTLPVAQFIQEAPHDELPVAVPVRVIHAASGTTKPPAETGERDPPGIVILAVAEDHIIDPADQIPIDDNSTVLVKDDLRKKSLWVTVFLLLLLAGALAGGGFAVYQFAAQPSLESSDVTPVGHPSVSFTRSPTVPTAPTTNVPTVSRAPTPPTPQVYGIELVYSPTPVPVPIRNAFELAKQKWQSILVEPGVSPRPPAGSRLCDRSDREYNGVETIDDLEISVELAYIDGERETLGFARPCGLVAGNTFRSVTGEIVLDIVDVEQLLEEGSLVDVIVHEMGHVLGIGSYWGSEYAEVVLPPSYIYTGVNGRDGFKDVNNGVPGSPPVELDGGSGTAYSHWDDTTFANELMTGYISTGTNPLSLLTVRSLIDLGYVVNVANADSYTRPGAGRRRRLRGGSIPNSRPRRKMVGESAAFHKRSKNQTQIVRVFDFAEDIPENDVQHFDRFRNVSRDSGSRP